nr:hypothetical protein [Tanacetum cinerariifolium]
MVDDDDETSKDKEIDKLMALISLSFKKIYKPTNNNLRTSYNTSRVNQDNSLRIYRNAGECQKPKRAKDAAYHREKMLLCKQEEAGIQLNAEQANWKNDTDDESDDQELEAHYMYMAKLQQVSTDAVDSGPIFDKEPEQKVQTDDHYDVFDIECQHPEQSESVHKTYLIEQDAHNVIIESVDMNYDSEQIDQNDEDDDLAKERELLASLIEKLKCEIDETKNRNKLLETSNKVLVEKLKSEIEDFKNKNKSLKEANNKLSEEHDLLYVNFKKSKAELKRRDSIEYASEMELECAKVKAEFYTYKKKSQMSCVKHTQKINDLNQTISEMKNKLSAHQDTISILKQQKDAQIKLYKSREDKELEKVIYLENKVKKAKQANPRLYDIGCYNDNLALMLSLESDEVIRLEKESRSKLSDLIRPFDYAKLNSLYDLFVPQRENSSEQRFFSERSRVSHIISQKEKKSFNKQPTLLEKRLDESIPLGKQCRSSLELFNVTIQATIIFKGVEMCKDSITKSTYFGYLDPFIKNTIEQKISPKIERILTGLNQFKRCLKEEMVAD